MIEMGKKYKTRDGRDVRIYATDAGGSLPVHGAIFDDDSSEWCVETWTADGRYFDDGATTGEDLIEVKPERWRPIVQRHDFFVYMARESHPTRELALDHFEGNATVIDAWRHPE